MTSREAILESWGHFLENEENKRRKNVIKLIDYYNGSQIDYLKEYIKIKKTSIDEFPYYYTNLTKRIIRKVAHVYKKPPVRLFNEKQNDKYGEITARKDIRMKTIERQARLLGVVGVRPTVRNDMFNYILLRDFNAYFSEDDPTEVIAIRYLVSGDIKLDPIYEYWDNETVFRVNKDNKVMKGTEKENPYGVIPFVWCYSEEIIDNFWNASGNADDLVNANEHINLKLTEMAHKYRFKSYDATWISGDVDNSDISLGYNKALILPPGATAGTIEQTHNFQDDVEAIKFDIQLIERNYNLAINWGIEGSTSGFQLVVMNIDHLDDLEDNIDIAREWENNLIEMERIVADVEGLSGVPKDELRVNFTEIQMPISQQEKNMKWQFEFDNGLSSRADYFRANNPDISDEEIQQKLEEIASEEKFRKEAVRTEPTIEEILSRE